MAWSPVERERAQRDRAQWDRAQWDRARFRAWVRANHPDVGGDPAEFAEGLRRIRASPSVASASRARATVVAVRRRRWPVRRLARWRERRLRAQSLL